MLSTIIIPALSLATLFASTTTAIPARTHCLCTIVHANKSHLLPPTRQYTDSNPFDICTTLGPELENFRHTEPDLYSNFISHAITTTISPDATSTDEEKPLATTVLLQLTARHGFQNLGVVVPSSSADRPQERIVCRTEVEGFSAYQDSLVTLLALQIIVGLAVLACIVEGVTLGLRIMSRRSQDDVPKKPALRLTGNERLLRALPTVEIIFSPGAEKKQRIYSSADWAPVISSGKREFEAYAVDSDDELSRPVM